MWIYKNVSHAVIIVVQSITYAASSTVQPSGMPLAPDGHEVIAAALTNVPDEATPESHDATQLDADMSVARHLTFASFVQPWNMEL